MTQAATPAGSATAGGELASALEQALRSDAITGLIQQAVKDAVAREMSDMRVQLDAIADRAGAAAALPEQIDQSISDLSTKLEMAKVELAGIRHPHASEDQLSTAMFELDEIITATQSATQVILNAAEKILDLTLGQKNDVNAATSRAIAAEMGDEVTRIFEACNFQDLTGQRITKVVDTFLKIEHHLSTIIKGFGRESFQYIPVGKEAHASQDGTVLTGPAVHNQGTLQSEIDDLFD
jgi:chemotaxis protein CheZ